MKTILRTILPLMLFFTVINCRATEKEAMAPEQLPAIAPGFKENKGQVIDTEGNLRNDILFYGSSNGVGYYITSKGISYVFRKEIKDSSSNMEMVGLRKNHKLGKFELYRVDMELVNSNSSLAGTETEGRQDGM